MAALMVVGVHAGPVLAPDAPGWLGGFLAHGQVAVDLFFVLSGFVLARGNATLSAPEVGRFLWRRAWRIYPLHGAVLGGLAAYVLLATAGGDGFIAPDFPWSRFAPTLLLLQPFLFHGATDWNPPDWSIAVEMLCSLGFWPALAGLRRVGRPLVVAGVLGAAAAANLAVHGGETAGWPAAMRGACGFGFGMALARVPLRAGVWPAAGAGRGDAAERGAVGGGAVGTAGRSLLWSGVELLAGGGFLASVAADRPEAAVVLAGGLILLLASGAGGLSWLLARGAGWLGRVSFSVYLVHVPLLIPFEGGWAWDLGWPGRVGVCTAYLACVLGVAALAWRWVEQPGRTLGARLAVRRTGRGQRNGRGRWAGEGRWSGESRRNDEGYRNGEGGRNDEEWQYGWGGTSSASAGLSDAGWRPRRGAAWRSRAGCPS